MVLVCVQACVRCSVRHVRWGGGGKRRTVAGDGTGHREQREGRQDGGARAAEGRDAHGQREHARTHDGLDEVRSGRGEAGLAFVLCRRSSSDQRRRPQHRARSGQPRVGMHLQRSDAAESEHADQTAHDGHRHSEDLARDLAIRARVVRGWEAYFTSRKLLEICSTRSTHGGPRY
jgi:hypothetical protein